MKSNEIKGSRSWCTTLHLRLFFAQCLFVWPGCWGGLECIDNINNYKNRKYWNCHFPFQVAWKKQEGGLIILEGFPLHLFCTDSPTLFNNSTWVPSCRVLSISHIYSYVGIKRGEGSICNEVSCLGGDFCSLLFQMYLSLYTFQREKSKTHILHLSCKLLRRVLAQLVLASFHCFGLVSAKDTCTKDTCTKDTCTMTTRLPAFTHMN